MTNYFADAELYLTAAINSRGEEEPAKCESWLRIAEINALLAIAQALRSPERSGL
ncbi:hypothetical protein [Mycobacterium intracellulare]|uniref:hypothetical protein n=1 Tax=Mycobacterium intracellulare TaxID=1767 RepID=UPI000A8FEFF4|nr:hypothetical protein [Mycobacterium intracellulare]